MEWFPHWYQLLSIIAWQDKNFDNTGFAIFFICIGVAFIVFLLMVIRNRTVSLERKVSYRLSSRRKYEDDTFLRVAAVIVFAPVLILFYPIPIAALTLRYSVKVFDMVVTFKYKVQNTNAIKKEKHAAIVTEDMKAFPHDEA